MKNKEIIFLFLSLILGTSVYIMVKENQLNLWTGWTFLFTLCFSFLFISEFVTRIFKRSTESIINIRVLVISICISLIGLEIFLRFGVNKYSSYSERNFSSNYYSFYTCFSSHYYKTRPRNATIWEIKSEFQIGRRTNSIGLSEREIPVTKEENEYRIFALGDSFTEGIGTYYDSTWVKVMEKNLETSYLNKFVNVFNCGISGSDIFFSYKLIKSELLKYEPNMVILALSSSDIMDIIIRGGEERFGDNDRVFYKEAPKFEWLYGISFNVRHIIHDIFKYNHLFLTYEEYEIQEILAISKIFSMILKFQELSLACNFDFVVVFHPLILEVKQGKFIFSDLIKRINESHTIHTVNVLEYYSTGKEKIKDNLWKYYWKLDQHHNSKGYKLMGNSISDAIIKMDIID